MLKHTLLALLFSVLASASPPDRGVEWKFLYEKDGFKAYEHKGPPLTYKAEGTVDVSLAEIAAVLVDIPRHPEWVHRLVECHTLEGNPITRCVVYGRYSLPWPATDRDAVLENVVEEDMGRGEVRVQFRNTTSSGAPLRPNCIRVPLSEGSFTIREIGSGSVSVSYVVRLDPGGWLPDWIVRLFVRDAPVGTLRAFKSQVLKTRGQYSAFVTAQKIRWARTPKPSH